MERYCHFIYTGERNENAVLSLGERNENAVLSIGERNKNAILSIGERNENADLSIGERNEKECHILSTVKRAQSSTLSQMYQGAAFCSPTGR